MPVTMCVQEHCAPASLICCLPACLAAQEADQVAMVDAHVQYAAQVGLTWMALHRYRLVERRLLGLMSHGPIYIRGTAHGGREEHCPILYAWSASPAGVETRC